MKQNNLSVKKLCMLVVAGMIFSMLAITVILGVVMKDVRILSGCGCWYCALESGCPSLPLTCAGH